MAKEKFNDPCGKRKDPHDVKEAYPKGRASRSYWDWCERHCPTDDTGRIIEPRGGNPAQFPEATEEDRSDELKAIVEVLNDGGLEKLSVRQRRAFRLVAIQGLTYAAAGKQMNISAMTVYEHVRAAGVRLKKLCEDKI